MKSLPKLIRRFVSIMLLPSAFLIVFNFILLGIFTVKQVPNGSPWTMARQVADNLSQNGGEYVLAEDTAVELQNTGAWGIFIDNRTMKIVWRTENLPDTVPLSYTISNIAHLTRGYIDGYPTFTGEAENGLVVLGYPKDSYWKHMWPSWDYDLIANLPKTVLSVLAINAAVIFIIYIIADSKLLKSVKPIVGAIQALSANEEVHIREKGLLSEVAVNINKTSDILQAQNRQLRKRETARANWIAGVSHDIRTPLSMVMGYAGQLESDSRLPEGDRKKAAVIVKQSERMRNLVNDLNLSSKLEYNMQPINPQRQNLIAVVRRVVVDFINVNIDEKYTFQWETNEELASCPVCIDRDLIKRAVSNLLQNSMNHNRRGCSIFVRVEAEESGYSVIVDDDGAGATDEQIEKLNHSPHYMVCDENTEGQRHGLGLLIVKQIATAHKGTLVVEHSARGGFCAKITLPIHR